MVAKILRIRFDKIDGFIKSYDETRYLVLFGPKRYDEIYDQIKYIITEKVVLHTLYLIIMQKTKLIHLILFNSLTFYVIILFNKDKYNYYNIFLKKLLMICLKNKFLYKI